MLADTWRTWPQVFKRNVSEARDTQDIQQYLSTFVLTQAGADLNIVTHTADSVKDEA